ncbi:MAG: crotonase/enoyl-CoA hydratase family protein [Ferruginibacter sp.]
MKSGFDYLNELPASLSVEIRDNILLVGINRIEKRNAINDEIILGFEKLFSNMPGAVACAIIYGKGKHFSAGVDLAEIKEQGDLLEGLLHSRMWHRVLDQLQFGPIPIVAMMHGAVLGGGLELACAAHIRVAEQSAFYALPEGQRGIFVGGGGSVRVPKLIGLARMTDMMMTGRVYSAEEGMAVGLSQYLVENGTGLDKAIELAKKISSNAPVTNYALMHVLPRITDSNPEQGLMMESLIATVSKNTPEAKERLKLFLEGKAKKVGL